MAINDDDDWKAEVKKTLVEMELLIVKARAVIEKADEVTKDEPRPGDQPTEQ